MKGGARAWGVCAVAGLLAVNSWAEGEAKPAADPYLDMAKRLAAEGQAAPVPVGVGNFLFEDTELMTPFSSVLREEMSRALAQTGKFRVISRDRLAELQAEGRFQDRQALEPGVATRGLRIENVKALVRGRFYYRYPEVTVWTELALLEGGDIQKAKAVVPVEQISARIWPDGGAAAVAPPRMEQLIAPQNAVASQANLQDVQKRLLKAPSDFRVNLAVREGKRNFSEGETISYRVTSDTGCHIAIFCHQVDGSSVLLFPNRFKTETWVPAGTAVDVPAAGADNFRLAIQEPWGADVVQVVACTRKTSLHQMVSQMASAIPKGQAVRGMDRGMVVQGLNDSLSGAPVGVTVESSGPPRWATAHVVVCTYPKMFDPSVRR